jgi:hypothetical protein
MWQELVAATDADDVFFGHCRDIIPIRELT